MSKNRRSACKYPGLDTNVNLPIRRETMDQDYIEKLNDEEKLMA